MDITETILATQAQGKTACVVDMRRAFDVVAAAAGGVNVERLLVSQPDDIGQAAEIVEVIVRSGAIDMVIVLGALAAPALDVIRRAAERTQTTMIYA